MRNGRRPELLSYGAIELRFIECDCHCLGMTNYGKLSLHHCCVVFSTEGDIDGMFDNYYKIITMNNFRQYIRLKGTTPNHYPVYSCRMVRYQIVILSRPCYWIHVFVVVPNVFLSLRSGWCLSPWLSSWSLWSWISSCSFWERVNIFNNVTIII